MHLQVPVPDCSCEQGGRVLAFLRDKTSPRETQEPCTNYWQGCRRIKVNQGGERSWDVNFVWFPGEPDDSVEDQREGGTSSAVQLVEGWFDIHHLPFPQDLRFWWNTFIHWQSPQCEDFYGNFSGRKIETDDDYQVETQEYQGGATAILQILKTQVRHIELGIGNWEKINKIVLKPFDRCPMREPTHSGEKIGMGATRWGSTTSRSPTSWSSSSPSPWRLTWTWWSWRLATTPSASCSSLETWNVDAAKVSGESSPSLTLQLWIENDNPVSRTSELSPAMQIAVDFGDESFANGIWDRLVFTILLVGKISFLLWFLFWII